MQWMDVENLSGHVNHKKAYTGVDEGPHASESIPIAEMSVAGSAVVPLSAYHKKAGSEAVHEGMAAHYIGEEYCEHD